MSAGIYLAIFGASCCAVVRLLQTHAPMAAWYPLLVGAAGLLVIAAEYLRPNTASTWLRRERIGDIVLAVLNAILINAYVYALQAVLPLAARAVPGIGHLWPRHFHIGLQLVLVFLIYELLVYWSHRAMHAVSWLWRFHRLHHAAEQLDWLNVLRFHPVDALLSNLFALTPLHLAGVPAELMIGSAALSQVGAFLQHANLGGSFFFLNQIFHTPDLHRFHHRAQPASERTVNFGATLILWDRIFGTRYAGKDTPRLGLVEEYPSGWYAQLLYPFGVRNVEQQRL